VAPAQGQYALELARIASDCMLAHGFEPMISITMITERALIGVISLTWDRDVAGEDSRAQQCFDDLQKQLVDAGYPPYRLGIRSMDITILGGGHEKLLNAIRDRFDPERILAPGRYDELPRASRSSE
jgi:4-cresol dehydrogenase (hydroxylating)